MPQSSIKKVSKSFKEASQRPRWLQLIPKLIQDGPKMAPSRHNLGPRFTMAFNLGEISIKNDSRITQEPLLKAHRKAQAASGGHRVHRSPLGGSGGAEIR